jgi:hypothetical protein
MENIQLSGENSFCVFYISLTKIRYMTIKNLHISYMVSRIHVLNKNLNINEISFNKLLRLSLEK